MYGAIIWIRNTLYNRRVFNIYHAPIPVISIGNITLGGTGKTPLAEYILAFYYANNIRAAYLSRGYGRSTKGFLWVKPLEGNAQDYGDEALQVAMKFQMLPVAVCEDREEGIQQILAVHSTDVIVLDDAFQHRKVHRNLDLLVIDANRLPAYDHLLPVGRLREPYPNIRRADMIIVNKLTARKQIYEVALQLASFNKPLAFATPVMKEIKSFWEADDKKSEMYSRAVVFSGLGNNDFFLQQVLDMEIIVETHFFFRDHHLYTENDIKGIVQKYREYASNQDDSMCILTTEKDFSRMKSLSWIEAFRSLPFCYVPISLEFWEGKEIFCQTLKSISTQ